MTVCIEKLCEGEHEEYVFGTAVSSVTEGRRILQREKESMERYGEIIEEGVNHFVYENFCGLKYTYRIVKYFSKEPI